MGRVGDRGAWRRRLGGGLGGRCALGRGSCSLLEGLWFCNWMDLEDERGCGTEAEMLGGWCRSPARWRGRKCLVSGILGRKGRRCTSIMATSLPSSGRLPSSMSRRRYCARSTEHSHVLKPPS